METGAGADKVARFEKIDDAFRNCAGLILIGWAVLLVQFVFTGDFLGLLAYGFIWGELWAKIYVFSVCEETCEMKWALVGIAGTFSCACCNGFARKMPCLSTKHDRAYARFTVYARECLGVPFSTASAWYIEYLIASGRMPAADFHPQLIEYAEQWHVLRRRGLNMHAPSLPVSQLEKLDLFSYPRIGSVRRTDTPHGPRYVYPEDADDVYDMVVDYIAEQTPGFDPDRE